MGDMLEMKMEMAQLAEEYMEEGLQKLEDKKMNHAALLIQNALHLSKAAENMKLYAKNLNLMGIIYAVTGNESMSIDYYLEGLECAMDYQFNDITMLFYNNIGSRYRELGENEKAVNYYLKAEKELHGSNFKDDESYRNRCLIINLNLTSSYIALEKYLLAKKCLEKARQWLEEEINNDYKLSFKIAEWRLYWEIGKKDYVKENIEEMLYDVLQDSNAADYVENMKLICQLMIKMKEYAKWKYVITTFETFAKEQDNVYYQLLLAEMWMEYYKVTDNRDKYVEYCIKHAETYQKQKVITEKERAAAIDIKIELFESEAERKRIELKSHTDSLTGIGNRYKLEEDFGKCIERACQMQKTIAFGLIDIDCFKEENDTYGHMKGDECLVHVAEILQKVIDGKGQAYRFGGDEFVLLIEDGTMENVAVIAKKIKENLHILKIDNVNSTIVPEVTVSQGYVSLVPKCDVSQQEMLQYADEALYTVKERGKNGYYILSK